MFATILLSLAMTTAQPPARPPVQWGPGENHALSLAWADSQKFAPEDRLYLRYVWVTNGKAESAQAAMLPPNYVSRASTITRPGLLDVSGVTLLRLDLRAYFPREADLKEALRLWEELQFDPRFSLLLTPDTIRFAALAGVEAKHDFGRVQRKSNGEPVYTDGSRDVLKGQDGRWVTRGTDGNWQYWQGDGAALRPAYEVGRADDVVRLPGPHLDKGLYARLVDSTQSQAPVVSHRYFLSRLLDTIKDKGAYKTIYGGLYYDFSGIGTDFKQGTDLDNYLERLGIGSVREGVTADKIFDRIRSDARVAVFRSNVTGKPRRIDFLPTLSNSLEIGLVSITHDPADEDVDIGTHPILNLLKVKAKALEVIAVKPNGLPEFPIFNGDGKRQDEVPPFVAHDRTIPSPYTMRLRPAISCIRCHISGSGWQPVTNDVAKIVDGKLDVFADVGGKGVRADDVDRIRGLYSGDPEFKLLPRGRDDHAAAVVRATGPWKATKNAQADAVALACKQVEQEYADHHYRPVDAAVALEELGVVNVPPGQAVQTFAALLPPVGPQEDPRPYALGKGLAIPRADWDLIYSIVATRMAKTGGRK